MDPRGRKAVALAVIPATMSGVYLPLITHLHHSRLLPVFAVGLPVLMCVPLVLALRLVVQIKRDGNPY